MQIFAHAAIRRFAFRAVFALASATLFSTLPLGAQSLGYEGPTGVFVTPLAYVAASPAKALGKPVVGYHFLAGGPVIGDFSTINITEGFGGRSEFGYTSEIHAAGSNATLSPLWAHDFSILHGKALLLPENYGKNKAVPAISVGGIFRFNDSDVYNGTNGQTTKNGDLYIVATKTITETKKVPILLSAGLRGTNSQLWGLGGNAPDWSARGFGAIAFVFTGPGKSAIIFASELSQQPNHLLATDSDGTKGGIFNIPTSEVYAVRIVPSPKHKLNIDAGVLHAANDIYKGAVKLNANARVAVALSYGF